MNVPRLGEPNNFWNAPAYTVKVRGLKYLWGSSGLTQELQFENAFILHIANDQAGKPVTVGTRAAAGTKTNLGTIEPGEIISVSVNNITGVYAECATDSVVHCFIYQARV
jgi:hypothetical protein